MVPAVMSLAKAARTLVKPARGFLGSFSSPTRAYAAVAEARAVLEKELDGIRAAGTWKAERIITSMQGPQINVDSSRSSECFNCGDIVRRGFTSSETVFEMLL